MTSRPPSPLTENSSSPVSLSKDDQTAAAEAVREKLVDVLTPGYQVDFDPAEAEQAGAFHEDALSEQDAAASAEDAAAVFLEGSKPTTVPPFVTRTNSREQFGLQQGESVADALRSAEAARG
jgi:hypothetical protein